MKKTFAAIMLLAFACLPLCRRVHAAETGHILFSGDARVVFESWEEDWSAAVTIEESGFDRESFQKPFLIEVCYTAEKAPYLVFSSWTGGENWAQMQPSYVLRGRAYYEYELITRTYGSDLSTLNRIRVMTSPSEEETVVTEVRCVHEDEASTGGFSCKGIAGRIVREIGSGWNLGNTLDAHGDWIAEYTEGRPEDYETSWGNPLTTKEMIFTIKESGFDAIRIPVTWAQHIDDQAGYRIDPSWMARVREIVDCCMEYDLYCIINLHHDTGANEHSWLKASEEGLLESREKFTAVWRQIAAEFADCDGRLLFEGFNELLDEEDNWEYTGADAGSVVNRFNQIFVDTVREAGGNNRFRCLIVNPYAAKLNAESFHDFHLPKDTVQDALIVGIHYYEPFSYSMDGGDGQSSWRDEDGEAVMEESLKLLGDRFLAGGIPVLITEFGARNKKNEADRADWAGFFRKRAESYGIKCFWWDPGGEMKPDSESGYYTGKGLYDRHHDKWIYPLVRDALTEELTE